MCAINSLAWLLGRKKFMKGSEVCDRERDGGA